MRRGELASTVAAAAFGAAVAATILGASLALVLPAALTVGLVGIVAERTRHG